MDKRLEAEAGEFQLTLGERPWLLPLKERLRIVDEYKAAHPLEDFPIEILRIVDSFSSKKERAAYRQRSELFRLYYQGLMDLEKCVSAYREAVAYGTGFTLLRESVKRMDELIQEITSEMIDESLLKKSLPKALWDKLPLIEASLRKTYELAVSEALKTKEMEALARLEYDKKLREARLVLGQTEDGTLEELKEDWLEEARAMRTDIYTVIKALKDGMKKLSYQPRSFKEQLDLVGEIIYEAVMSPQVLPPLKSKTPGRGPKAKLTVLEASRRPPINKELYDEWMEAIEATKKL